MVVLQLAFTATICTKIDSLAGYHTMLVPRRVVIQLFQRMVPFWDSNLRGAFDNTQVNGVWNDFRRQPYFCDGNLADLERLFFKIVVNKNKEISAEKMNDKEKNLRNGMLN
jgi:hypothetical protein